MFNTEPSLAFDLDYFGDLTREYSSEKSMGQETKTKQSKIKVKE